MALEWNGVNITPFLDLHVQLNTIKKLNLYDHIDLHLSNTIPLLAVK